jgi:diguanylate cyclase (GGDEF)-like protein
LVAQGEALGVLYLSSRVIGAVGADSATAAKQRLAEAVAAQLALGLANVRLREILRNQSIRDPLTGLFNRRYMEETLERELRRARRGNRSMGVLMLDLDRFKQLNDTAGHEAGDAFLRELGELLQRSLRREDIPCRHGGEEFVVVLPDASLEDARRRAEQLREGIKLLRTPYKGGIVGPLSASIGVAAYPEHGSTGEALIRTADAALYRAKREGRDRVMVATLNEGSVSTPER